MLKSRHTAFFVLQKNAEKQDDSQPSIQYQNQYAKRKMGREEDVWIKNTLFQFGVTLYSLDSQRGIQEARARARCRQRAREPAGGGAMPKRYLQPAPGTSHRDAIVSAVLVSVA